MAMMVRLEDVVVAQVVTGTLDIQVARVAMEEVVAADVVEIKQNMNVYPSYD